jgi:hypothetical protein
VIKKTFAVNEQRKVSSYCFSMLQGFAILADESGIDIKNFVKLLKASIKDLGLSDKEERGKSS